MKYCVAGGTIGTAEEVAQHIVDNTEAEDFVDQFDEALNKTYGNVIVAGREYPTSVVMKDINPKEYNRRLDTLVPVYKKYLYTDTVVKIKKIPGNDWDIVNHWIVKSFA